VAADLDPAAVEVGLVPADGPVAAVLDPAAVEGHQERADQLMPADLLVFKTAYHD